MFPHNPSSLFDVKGLDRYFNSDLSIHGALGTLKRSLH
jgi:hypothetical protein